MILLVKGRVLQLNGLPKQTTNAPLTFKQQCALLYLLLCLTPDDFTCHGESVASLWLPKQTTNAPC